MRNLKVFEISLENAHFLFEIDRQFGYARENECNQQDDEPLLLGKSNARFVDGEISENGME